MSVLEDEDADLLPDHLLPKGKAVPLRRSRKQLARIEAKEEADALGAAREAAALAAQEDATRLAQIANLIIAGHSLDSIAVAIGATPEELDALVQRDMARYVRSQPALRVFVRNWISEKYGGLLEAVWSEATDRTHREKLENQDRALRILDRMAKLHGAEAPVQSEVKVDAAPEAVEKMVAAIAAQAGKGYDASIFDVVDAEVVHEVHESTARELEEASDAVEREG